MTMKPVHVTRDMAEKRMQKALLRWGDPANRPLVEEALRRTGRLAPGQRLGPGLRPPGRRRHPAAIRADAAKRRGGRNEPG
jgi:hypothetical protein